MITAQDARDLIGIAKKVLKIIEKDIRIEALEGRNILTHYIINDNLHKIISEN